MNKSWVLLAVLGCVAPGAPPDPTPGADLKPATVAAFQAYVQSVEARIDERVSGRTHFLWLDDSPARRARVRGGEVVTERAAGTSPAEVTDGLIHDFIGAIFIPGATMARVMAFIQDYDHHKNYYGPEVVDAHVLSRDGDHFVVSMRLKKHKVMTVVLDTEHDARFFQRDQHSWFSRSRTTKVAEVEDPGTPQERRLPAGSGHGFMWGLNSYWRFLERDGGVYVECQAVSLSRGIPWGLGWLIGPIVNDLPKDSLANTLTSTRNGLAATAGTPRRNPLE